MTMRRFLYTLIIVFGIVSTTNAQLDPLFFQQTNLRALINPASTGKGGDINIAATMRMQWIGFTGMSSQAAQAHGFVNSLRSGFGARFVMDEYGPKQTKNIKLNYAFYAPINDDAFLSLGLGLGVINNVYKGGDYFFPSHPDDPSIPMETKSDTRPDLDFGIEFNTSRFEIGAAATHMISSFGTIFGDSDPIYDHPMRNYYVYSRAKLSINPHWDFIPGATWHFNQWQSSYEVIMGVRYDNNLIVNVAYRNQIGRAHV